MNLRITLISLALAAATFCDAAAPAAPPTVPSPAPTPSILERADPVPRHLIERSLGAAFDFLRRAQNQDGSFGSQQVHLQTGLAVLAFLSQGATPDQDPKSPIPAACRWLIQNSSENGFMGDGEYPLESSAVAALALSEAIGMLPDPELDREVAQRADQALRYALGIQDKAQGAEFTGGWKADPKRENNDRRVTTWYLLLLKSMELRGRMVPDTSVKRGLAFLLCSQKVPGPSAQFDKSDLGGFSYDAAGLPVVSITAAGLTCMSLFDTKIANRNLALDWFNRHPPIWYGPNFYDTYFFAARGYAREKTRGPGPLQQAAEFSTKIWQILSEHQNPDGSFEVPPGNAENTHVMGKTYATPMAILILNAERNLLPIDATD